MSIKYKLYGLCVAFLLALLFSCSMAITFMEKINESTNIISRNWLPSVIIAEELSVATSDFRNAEANHIISRRDSSMEGYERTISNTAYQIDTLFREYYTDRVSSQVDRELINRAHSKWQEYMTLHEKVMEASRVNGKLLAMDILETESKEIFDEVSNVFLELVAFNKNGADEARKSSDIIFKNTTRMLIFLMFFTATLGGLASYIFIQKITKPVAEVQRAASQIVKGDLSTEIVYTSDDELGRLASSMRDLCSMFQGIIADLSQLLRKLSNGDFTAKSQRPDLYVGEFSALLELTENISEKLTNFLSNTKRLQKISEQDSLTQLYNQGYFHSYANERVPNLESGCLVLVDIDYFKQVNDTHGHQAGDTVIKEVAKVLEKYFRSNDIVARLGGDEFIILLEQEVAIDFLEQRAQNILNDLASDTNEVPVSLSIGGYIFKKPMTYKKLYSLADKNLYKVKEKGRNGFAFDKAEEQTA